MKISKNLKENTCVGFSLTIKFQAGSQIETPVQVSTGEFYCESIVSFKKFLKDLFYKYLGTAAFEEQYLLQESLFVMHQVFTINRTDNCFTMKELRHTL